MEQRLGFGDPVEVAALAPQQQVRQEARPARHVQAEPRELVGQQRHPADREACGHHDDQRREDPAHPPLVEARQREAAGAEVAQQDRDDQEARDHEEHVDAHEAARGPSAQHVEGEHQQHRHGPQAVDVGPVGMRQEGRGGGGRVGAGRARPAPARARPDAAQGGGQAGVDRAGGGRGWGAFDHPEGGAVGGLVCGTAGRQASLVSRSAGSRRDMRLGRRRAGASRGARVSGAPRSRKARRPHRCGRRVFGSGRGERIRTSGLYVPNVALYQAKLHPEGPAAVTRIRRSVGCPGQTVDQYSSCRAGCQRSRSTACSASAARAARCSPSGNARSAAKPASTSSRARPRA